MTDQAGAGGFGFQGGAFQGGALAGAMGATAAMAGGAAFGQGGFTQTTSVVGGLQGQGQGHIRLEKVEHYPSYNLFSILDDHSPQANFRLIPHKLKNY